MTSQMNCEYAIGIPRIGRWNVKGDRRPRMIRRVMKRGAQTADAGLARVRYHRRKRRTGSVKKFHDGAVSLADGQTAHARLKFFIARLRLQRVEHSRLRRKEIAREMHDRFEIVSTLRGAVRIDIEPMLISGRDIGTENIDVSTLVRSRMFVQQTKRVPHLVANLRAR